MKTCSKCKIEKDESEFGKCKGGKNGLKSRCKKCTYENDKLRKADGRYRDYHKDYYLKNKDKIIESHSIWKSNNKDYMKKQRSEKFKELKNSDKYDEYKLKHNEYMKNYMPEYLKNKKETDEHFNLRCKISCCFRQKFQVRKIEKTQAFFNYTNLKIEKYVEYFNTYYPSEFKIYLKNTGEYHIDHIIPCVMYDLSNPEHIKLCWQPENLRIIPAKENLEKSDKLDFDLIDKHGIRHLLPK